jgi:hypothetical protein
MGENDKVAREWALVLHAQRGVPRLRRDRRAELPPERASEPGQPPRQPQPRRGRHPDVPVRPGGSYRTRLRECRHGRGLAAAQRMAGQTPPLSPHSLRASTPNKDAGYFWPAWGPEVSRTIVGDQPNTDYFEWKALIEQAGRPGLEAPVRPWSLPNKLDNSCWFVRTKVGNRELALNDPRNA